MFSRVCSTLFRQFKPWMRVRHICNSSRSKLVVSRRFMVSAAVMAAFDWDQEKSTDKELVTFIKELDYCRQLKLETLTCLKCRLRLRIDVEVEGISYCKCDANDRTKLDSWVPYLERKDIFVWRKEHEVKHGLYQYRLYGVLDDVTVWEFLAVQLDLSKFRTDWDASTAKVDLVESNGDDGLVYHWEVNWPTFFSNRDYCCLRQMIVSPQGEAVVTSSSCCHPSCPEGYRTHRVKDYKSVLTMRPAQTGGVEFCLTAFEDQGVKLPESIISWVAMRAMPELISNLRAACLKLRDIPGLNNNNEDSPCPNRLKKMAEEKNNCFKSVTETVSEEISQSAFVEPTDQKEEPSDKDLPSEISELDSLSEGCLRKGESMDDRMADIELNDRDLALIDTVIGDVDNDNSESGTQRFSMANINANYEEAISPQITYPVSSLNDSSLEIIMNPVRSGKMITNPIRSQKMITSPVSSPVRYNLLYPGYVEHELELLLYEERELELDLGLLNLKMKEIDGKDKECEEAIQSWCRFVSRKSKIFHRKMLLELLGEEKQLENKCLMLQQELRQFVDVQTDEDKHREQLLLEELVMVVNQRDQLVMKVDDEENNIQNDDLIRLKIDENNNKNKFQMQ